MDKYDRAIESLMSKPDLDEACYRAWMSPRANPNDPEGCLFQYVTPSGHPEVSLQTGQACGCLTQVHTGVYDAWTPELEKEIQEDPRLPSFILDMSREKLEALAEWQRRLDREIRQSASQST